MARAKAKSKSSAPRMPSEKQWRAENMMVEVVKKMPAFKAGVRKAMSEMARAEKDAVRKMKGMM